MISFYSEGYFIAPDDNDVDYGPGDTQNLFFSSILCQEISPNKNSLYSDNFLPSTLYLLRDPPTLSGEIEVSFEDMFLIYDQVHQRNFHLFPGSVISVDACVDQRTHTGVGTFYLVKGKSIFNDWLDAGGKSAPQSVETLQVQDSCGELGDSSVMYTVIEEDQYYLVFTNDKHVSPYIAAVNASFNIQRRIYKHNESAVVNSCNFTSSPCTLQMPFKRLTSVFLTYGEPENWEDNWSNKAIRVECVSRVWFYTILTALGVLLIAGSIFIGCVICYSCTRVMLTEDEAGAPLLNKWTGSLYSSAPATKEMDMYNQDRPANEYSKASDNRVIPEASARRPRTLPKTNHTPPSFKPSPGLKYTMGLPTYETFTRR